MLGPGDIGTSTIALVARPAAESLTTFLERVPREEWSVWGPKEHQHLFTR